MLNYFNLKDEITLSLILILFGLWLSSTVYALEPNFVIDTTLSNTNLNLGESVRFKIIAHGTGSCNTTIVGIVTDSNIEINKESISFSYADGGNVGYNPLSPTEKSTASYFCSDNQIYERKISENETLLASELFVNLSNLFMNDGLHFLRGYGYFNVSTNTQGGDYKFKVIFICDEYQFIDEREYRLKYEGEETQYLVAIISIIFSILIFVAGIEYGRKRKFNDNRNIKTEADESTIRIDNRFLTKILDDLKDLFIEYSWVIGLSLIVVGATKIWTNAFGILIVGILFFCISIFLKFYKKK